ncbi:MAG: hypothetical protein ACYDEV_14555 [Acidiferrobacter sp.]
MHRQSRWYYGFAQELGGGNMLRGYKQFNPKRKMKGLEGEPWPQRSALLQRIRYGGNPEHKKNPGDFRLTPPAHPRPGKSLCDDAGVFSKRVALTLLKAGLSKGLVSERFVGDWPQNIWSVTEDGKPMEAQLENAVTGTYHGYPMPEGDPLAADVVLRWNSR